MTVQEMDAAVARVRARIIELEQSEHELQQIRATLLVNFAAEAGASVYEFAIKYQRVSTHSMLVELIERHQIVAPLAIPNGGRDEDGY